MQLKFKRKEYPKCVDCTHFRQSVIGKECWHPRLTEAHNTYIWNKVHHPLVDGVEPTIIYDPADPVKERSKWFFGCTFRGFYFEPKEDED